MKGWKTVNEIKDKLEKGQSVSSVARQLGVDRKTVRKYRNMPLDEFAEYRKRARIRRKKLSHFAEFIKARLEAMGEDGMVNAQAIYEDLQKRGYSGSARSVRRWVQSLRKPLKQRKYQPFETEPGHQAMVDFGEKRKVKIGGGVTIVYFAAMVLSYSRKKYISWFNRPIDTEMFLQFHHEAFCAFKGVPQEIVYDQTKVAVLQEEYGEVDFNEAFYKYAKWSGFKPHVCRKYDPETKGKVEAVISYVKKNFLLGKSFEGWGDLLRKSECWLKERGNGKRHETTGEIPEEAWVEERGHLKPYQPSGHVGFMPAYRRQTVYKDGLVKVLGNRYSVPSSQQGNEVKVRITADQVIIHDLEGQHLWTHQRIFGKGKRQIVKSHYRKERSEKTEILALEMKRIFGDAFAAAVKKNYPRHTREQYQQLTNLKNHYREEDLKHAADQLPSKYASYKNLKRLLSNGDIAQITEQAQLFSQVPMPPDMELEERDSAYYDHALAEV